MRSKARSIPVVSPAPGAIPDTIATGATLQWRTRAPCRGGGAS
jgi:hypothetical protein